MSYTPKSRRRTSYSSIKKTNEKIFEDARQEVHNKKYEDQYKKFKRMEFKIRIRRSSCLRILTTHSSTFSPQD
jgi:hypothetical protein